MEPLPEKPVSAGGKTYYEDAAYEPLNGAIGRAAVNGQIVAYPKIIRSRIDPPIPDQVYCLISFLHFDKEHIAKDRHGKETKIKTLVKVRGTFGTENEAIRKAAELVRNVDSTFEIAVARVGKWEPVVEDIGSWSAEKVSAESEKQLEAQQSQVEIRRQKTKEYEESKKMQEFQENQRKLIEEDSSKDPESLDFATMQSVIFLKLHRDRKELKAKLDNLTKKLKDQHETLEYMRRRHPEHFENDAWLEHLNKARRKTSLVEEALTPEERDVFGKRLDKTRVPKGVTRTPKRVMLNLKGPNNDPGNFESVYPEYEEDYALSLDDTDVDKILKAQNLKLYREKVEKAARGDRVAMAAICPWKLDDLGRILTVPGAPIPRLPPGTEDSVTYPDTENIPDLYEAEQREMAMKGSRQQVFSGLEEPEPTEETSLRVAKPAAVTEEPPASEPPASEPPVSETPAEST